MSKKGTKQFTDTDFVIQERHTTTVPGDISEQTQGYIDVIKEIGEETRFVIEERDVPKRSGRKSSLNYPIDKLTPGSKESFLVAAKADKVKNVLSSIRTFAFRNKLKVTLRVEADGVRVWRKEEKATA